MTTETTSRLTLCPLCVNDPYGIPRPSCALCLGWGTLTLGPAALSIYDAHAVAAGVALVCVPAATRGRSHLGIAARMLREAGVLYSRHSSEVAENTSLPKRPSSYLAK